MRKIFVTSCIILLLGGCRDKSNPMGPNTEESVSNSSNNTLYTFSVSKSILGIFDTLDMTVSATNLGNTPDSIIVSDYEYTWSLTNISGQTVASGPTVISNLISTVVLSSHQTQVLYHLGFTMADIFRSPIPTGMYSLHWNMRSGLLFRLQLNCGKGNDEVSDLGGVSSPIFPLKVGNTWTYRANYYTKSGTLLFNETNTQSIIGEKMLNGEKLFLMVSDFWSDQFLIARNNGIYVYYPDLKMAALKFKYPSTAGEQYSSGYDFWNDDTVHLEQYQTTVDSVNEIVSVPQGSYQCYKYIIPTVNATFGNSSTIVSGEIDYYSNVGLVRRINDYIVRDLIRTNF
ncbi:MAG TPA: hypothetical protein VMU30_07650 [Bacteroidota bacterium]|nr:hypothetical protein [Bacteroidota bacterium]